MSGKHTKRAPRPTRGPAAALKSMRRFATPRPGLTTRGCGGDWLTPDTLLALQRHAGNRAVQRVVASYATPDARETPEERASPSPHSAWHEVCRPGEASAERNIQSVHRRRFERLGLGRGWVEVDDSGDPFTVKGTAYGSIAGSKGQESYSPNGSEGIPIPGALEWEEDPDHDMLIVKDIHVTPKRTAVGNILMYHFVKLARAEKVRFVGTALSALEEGTPEFYQKVGLEPYSMVGTDMTAQADTLLAARDRRQQVSGRQQSRRAEAASLSPILGRHPGSAETVQASHWRASRSTGCRVDSAVRESGALTPGL